MNVFRNVAYHVKKAQKKARRWMAADLIKEEIGLRLRAMAAVFPDFARQLIEAASAAEAEEKAANIAIDKANKAKLEAEIKRQAAQDKAAGVKLLKG
jgi:hypothetical protein